MAKRRKHKGLNTVMSALRQQRKAFRRKFGRDPGPNDPVFFDPSKDEPTSLDQEEFEAETTAALRQAGISPAIIFAYKKTGRLLVESMMDNYPPDAVQEWNAALDEYKRLEALRQGDHVPGEVRLDAPERSAIPALKDRPWSGGDTERLEACIAAINDHIGEGRWLNVRVELAAVLLADICYAAFQNAVAEGQANEGPERYELFEQMIVTRVLELNGRRGI